MEIVKKVLSYFQILGNCERMEVFGNGLINDTYVATTDDNNIKRKYTVQRINHNIFKNVPALMDNILAVTKHLKNKIIQEGGNPEKETLNVIMSRENKPYAVVDGFYYRVYDFIDDVETFQVIKNDEIFFESAIAAARFQQRLADFDASTLFESIPNFHNTVVRFEALKKAINDDKLNRAKEMQKEIEFALSHEYLTDMIMSKLDSKELPLKVTHNDTKLNNILFEKETNKGLCVIDLDTIMPGTMLFDYGEALRTGCNRAQEAEKDLTLVNFDINLFEIYTKGYLAVMKDTLCDTELKLMPYACMIMTFENGIRFLTDYLEGDTYFKIKYKEHNIDRCRTQFKLVSDMEKCIDKLKDIVASC